MSAVQPLRVAVVGAGAFGRNHLRVYRELEREARPIAVQLAAIIEPNLQTAAALAAEVAVPVFSSVDECVHQLQSGSLQLDAASICVPTVHHAAAAQALLAAGVDLLIEKPFAASLAEADSLIELAHAHGRILQIGHLERFNPAVTAIQPHLNQPMFFEAHRLSIFTPRSLDVDVVLDLMIHDLDVVLSFVQSPVREVRAVGLPVLSRKVDIANVRVEFESGCIANFTASRVSTERVRKLRFFQPHQYISLDYARQDALVIDVTAAANPALLANLAAAPGNAHPSEGLALRKIPVTAGEPLRLEIESFLESVRTRKAPRVSAQDGRAALALALEINRTIADHAQRAGLLRFIHSPGSH
ncbi:MAG: Gfo/Idh/MocA family protein [Acidobacteriaceae bacterium]